MIGKISFNGVNLNNIEQNKFRENSNIGLISDVFEKNIITFGSNQKRTTYNYATFKTDLINSYELRPTDRREILLYHFNGIQNKITNGSKELSVLNDFINVTILLLQNAESTTKRDFLSIAENVLKGVDNLKEANPILMNTFEQEKDKINKSSAPKPLVTPEKARREEQFQLQRLPSSVKQSLEMGNVLDEVADTFKQDIFRRELPKIYLDPKKGLNLLQFIKDDAELLKKFLAVVHDEKLIKGAQYYLTELGVVLKK
jgi:hypothetical protein